MKGQTEQRAKDVLDHLLLGISDLDKGIQWVREQAGVTAVMGGSHPGVGTRNALFSLGSRQYIEIVSTDPRQTGAGRTAAVVRGLAEPQLIGWAVATSDILSVARSATDSGYEVEGPVEGARLKPDGGTLGWKTLRILSDYADVIPFFIEWNAGTVHPSQDSPAGCRLVEFEIRHPEADGLRRALQNIGIQANVRRDNRSRLKAILDTPLGRIQF